MADKLSDDGSYDFAEPEPPRPTPPPAPKRERPPADAPRPARPESQRPQPARQTPPPTSPAAEAAADLPLQTCLHCGYSYRGKRKPRCPECASPSDAATDLLQFADGAWVRSVSTGLMLIVPGILLHIAGCVFNYLKLGPAKGIAHVAGAALVLLGAYLASRKDPSGVAANRGAGLIAQALALLTLIVWLIAGALAVGLWQPQQDDYTQLKKTLTLLVLVPQAAMCVAFSIHCARLAARIPSDSLSFHSNLSGWLSGVVCIALFVIIGLEMNHGFFPMFFMCSYPMVAGMIAILLWACITLIRLGLELRVAAAAGEVLASKRLQRQQQQPKRDNSGGSPLGLK